MNQLENTIHSHLGKLVPNPNSSQLLKQQVKNKQFPSWGECILRMDHHYLNRLEFHHIPIHKHQWLSYAFAYIYLR